MKKILFLAFVSLSIAAKAQFILEHTYDSASVWNTCSGNINQMLLVKFEVSGERYVKINRCGAKLLVYDLNHSLVNSISMSGFPRDASNQLGTILYLSENLFDNDPGMEFMYTYTSPATGFYKTLIYDDNGSIIFTEDGGPLVLINVPQAQCPIYNTVNGTKLILSYANGQAKVFGLPGTLTTAIEMENQNLLNPSNLISNPSPNPTNSTTRIGYNLPNGVSQGEIVFYDLMGNEVKRFAVDNTFEALEISTDDLAAGTYYYQLQTAAATSEGKKMIIIKQ